MTDNLLCFVDTLVFPAVVAPHTMHRSVPTPVPCVVVEDMRKQCPLPEETVSVTTSVSRCPEVLWFETHP